MQFLASASHDHDFELNVVCIDIELHLNIRSSNCQLCEPMIWAHSDAPSVNLPYLTNLRSWCGRGGPVRVYPDLGFLSAYLWLRRPLAWVESEPKSMREDETSFLLSFSSFFENLRGEGDVGPAVHPQSPNPLARVKKMLLASRGYPPKWSAPCRLLH